MNKNLREEFRRFEGQPVKIYTDDGRVYKGIDLEAGDSAVHLIDRCGRLYYIEYCHIDAVEEPQMALRNCCKCYDGDDNGNGKGDDGDDEERGGNGYYGCGCGCGRSRCC